MAKYSQLPKLREGAADEGAEHADGQSLGRLALLRHGIAVKAGIDRGRRAGDVDEGRGDEAAADAAYIDGDQQRKALHSGQRIRKGYKEGNAEGRGQSGDAAENNADKHAQSQHQKTHRVTEDVLETKNDR